MYGLDTSCFYTDEEIEIERRLNKARQVKNKHKNKLKKRAVELEKLKKKIEVTDVSNQQYIDLQDKYNCSYRKLQKATTNTKHDFKRLNTYIRDTKLELKAKLSQNVCLTRKARPEKILNKDGLPSLKRRVSVFDGCLTRCFEMKERAFNDELVIIKVYYYDIAQSIVKNGFYIGDEKYVFFSASAGQIRTKKLVAVKENLLKQHWNTFTANLSIEDINSQQGMNINKYLAYLALCNSATDLWEDFDLDRCIVVDDFANSISGMVDFIDEKKYAITRQEMSLPFTQTDGCGMMLPSVSKKNFMVRLPWVKGLLATFDYVRFIKDNNAIPEVKDIYGDIHNIIEEDIRIIFTKSQFKMWNFCKNWQEYKDNFKKYNCTAGRCNIEEDTYSKAVINYQMIQTLPDLSDEEITCRY